MHGAASRGCRLVMPCSMFPKLLFCWAMASLAFVLVGDSTVGNMVDTSDDTASPTTTPTKNHTLPAPTAMLWCVCV